MNINKKEKSIRRRMKPKPWDSTFILTYSNLKTFRKLLSLLKGAGKSKITILDLGCGYKPFEILFRESGFYYEYIGVDFNIESASPDIILDLNCEKLPFDDENFDVIILSEVLEHIYKTDNIINETLRVLKSGGYIYISTPFVFPEHGHPYDYFRFTEFYYLKLAEEKKLQIITISKAGNYLNIPLITINLLFEAVLSKLKLFLLAYPICLFNNLVALTLDFTIKTLKTFSAKTFERFKRFYIGISIIYQKP